MMDPEFIKALLVAFNGQQHLDQPKLTPGADPFMLAAYCFDLTRKKHYAYKLLRGHLQQPASFSTNPRDIAREVQRDNETIDAAGQNWEPRARQLEQIIIRLYQEINEDYRQVLQQMTTGHGH